MIPAYNGVYKSTQLTVQVGETYIFPLDNNSRYIQVINISGSQISVNLGSSYMPESAIILKRGSNLKMPTPQQLAITSDSNGINPSVVNIIEMRDYNVDVRMQP